MEKELIHNEWKALLNAIKALDFMENKVLQIGEKIVGIY